MAPGKQKKDADPGDASKPLPSKAEASKTLKTVRKIVKKTKKNAAGNNGESKSTPASQNKSINIKDVKVSQQARGKVYNKNKSKEENKVKSDIQMDKEVKATQQAQQKVDTKIKSEEEIKVESDIGMDKHGMQIDENSKEKSLVSEKKEASSTKESGKLNSDNRKGIIKDRAKDHSESEQKNTHVIQGGLEKKQKDQKKKGEFDSKKNEKLGGLIFMCNAKTKPDCLRYMVMGLPGNKKELIKSVKRGLKLFLYDFDVRHLYGIYEAASPGGMNLEPAAFNGSFPAQVRFKVHMDCLPIPLNVFKDAIKANYDERNNKFKTELTVHQVRKLTELFHPIPMHAIAPPLPLPAVVHPLPSSFVPVVGFPENIREAQPYVHKELSPQKPFSLHESRRYKPSHESEKEQFSRDMRYMPSHDYERERSPQNTRYKPSHDSERERLHESTKYKSSHDYERDRFPQSTRYLLSHDSERERPAKSTGYIPSHDSEREKFLNTASKYGDSVPVQREVVPRDPLSFGEKEYRTYGLALRERAAATSAPTMAPTTLSRSLDSHHKSRDPYYSHLYSGSSSVSHFPTTSEPYSLLPRRETYATDSDYSHRRDELSYNKRLATREGHSNSPTSHDYYGIPRRIETEYGGRVNGLRTYEAERVYSDRTVDPCSDYRGQQYSATRPDVASVPVSSRYAFPGPSRSYR